MYTQAIEVVPMLTVDDFISLVMSLILLTGFAFTLPVVMILLTSIKIVPAAFWKQQWRYAILLFLILSAIITPDGSGVSVMLLAVPLCILYGCGTVVSMLTEKTTKNM
jgi:sec-independent protein translocase protein TatC